MIKIETGFTPDLGDLNDLSVDGIKDAAVSELKGMVLEKIFSSPITWVILVALVGLIFWMFKRKKK